MILGDIYREYVTIGNQETFKQLISTYISVKKIDYSVMIPSFKQEFQQCKNMWERESKNQIRSQREQQAIVAFIVKYTSLQNVTKDQVHEVLHTEMVLLFTEL